MHLTAVEVTVRNKIKIGILESSVSLQNSDHQSIAFVSLAETQRYFVCFKKCSVWLLKFIKSEITFLV